MNIRRLPAQTNCDKMLAQGNGAVGNPDALFIDDWLPQDDTFLVKCLQNTVTAGGFVCGAFWDQALKGLISVEG